MRIKLLNCIKTRRVCKKFAKTRIKCKHEAMGCCEDLTYNLFFMLTIEVNYI